MSAAAAVAAVGVGLQIYGNWQANKAQAKAEEQNAAFYRDQARQAEEAARREEEIYRADAEQFFGEQVSSFAKAGVDISGSPLMVLSDTKVKVNDEIKAIRSDGAFKVRLANLRAQSSMATARQLKDPMNNLLSGFGTAAGGMAPYVGRESDAGGSQKSTRTIGKGA